MRGHMPHLWCISQTTIETILKYLISPVLKVKKDMFVWYSSSMGLFKLNKFKGANQTLLLIKKHISMLHFIIQNNELYFKHYFIHTNN